jgi:hypothetical protein
MNHNEENLPEMERSASKTESRPEPAKAPSWSNPASALLDRFRALALDTRGGMLLETVVAIIVFALIGTTVLVGVSTARRSGAIVDHQSIAENVARNQMEYTFSRAY